MIANDKNAIARYNVGISRSKKDVNQIERERLSSPRSVKSEWSLLHERCSFFFLNVFSLFLFLKVKCLAIAFTTMTDGRQRNLVNFLEKTN